jgi:hypothetical protein
MDTKAIEELIENIKELKHLLSEEGDYSICRTDKTNMWMGDELIVDGVLEKIDNSLNNASSELVALKSKLAEAEKVINKLMKWIIELEESGDNGQWDVEGMKEIIAARKFLEAK